MNNMPKYIVSKTLGEAKWNNSSLIKGNVAENVFKLKAMPGGDILVAGSGQLVNTLMQHNLIDEFRLMVYPVILGSGRRLFNNDGDSWLALRLMEAKPVGSGILILIYHPERMQ